MFLYVGSVLHIHAAIHLYYLTGYVGGEVGSEEEGYVGDIFRRSTSAEGYLFCPFSAYVFGQRGGHGCFYESGSYCVGTDAA